MGEVFHGTDTRLHRRVAIKVLPIGASLDEQMRARFAREARAVAALTHPHICTLYDVGRHNQVDYLVMEYLEGETLAARLGHGPLLLDQALTFADEIASALDHAHRHGIIHRDLKPANIMLTSSGAKLLDFGLAKFRPAAGVEDADLTRATTTVHMSGPGAFEGSDSDDAPVTRGGAIMGTLRYMAPEQIEGHEVDARSDLFSFGTVLYEMLTGKRAFDGSSATDLRASILGHEPPPVSSVLPLVPTALDGIVRRCLAKDRDRRWQTAGDVLRELKQVTESSTAGRTHLPAAWKWAAAILVTAVTGLVASLFTGGFPGWSTTPPVSQIRSVAVLPLENLSGDPNQEYFADGMTERLTADLAMISGLRVISRTSVMGYRSARKPVPTIARELQVDAIIEGSVAGATDMVRITVKLIRGATGEIIWSQSFERDVRDVLSLQREVARIIVSKVGVTLTPQEQARLATARTVNPQVHRQVLLGRYHAARATGEGVRKAINLLEAAVVKDPADALAHASLAEAYTALSGFYAHPREIMPKAKRAAETAVQLDETLADGHAALGYVNLVYDWNGPVAERSLLRALDLNPTLASARLSYAAYLASQARRDEAVREVRRAVDLDPLSVRTHTFGSMFLIFARNYDESIELARKALELDPNAAWALAFQGAAYGEQRRFKEAVDNLQRAAELDNSPTIMALKAHVLAISGQKEQAREVIRQVEETFKNGYFCPYEIGHVYVSLGDHDTAVDWFRKGLADRADCMPWLGVEPWIDPFRPDPRYSTLLREIGLDPSAR